MNKRRRKARVEPECTKELIFIKRIVGVAACPAGIAHTFMAAEAMERLGKKLGYCVKIETNGASGVGNRLSAEDILRADAVVIAADTAVETERFRGKPLLAVPVGFAIKKTAEVFRKIEDGELGIY